MFAQFKLKALAAVAIGALSLSFSASAWAERGVTSDKIVLGQSAALTGPAKDLGLQMRLGAQAYFDYLNKNGGVNGRKVELISLDDGYEPAKAKENTEKLINDSQVFSLFGYVGTPTSAAARPVFEKARVPFVAPFSGAESLRNPVSPWIFNLRGSYFDETELMIQHLNSFGIRKVAVFYQNDAYGQAGLAGVKKAMDKRSLPIAVTGTVERNSSDVSGAVKTISAQNPDAIVMVSAYSSASTFIKDYKKTGRPTQFFNVSFVGSNSLADALGVDGYGTIIAQVVPVPTERSLPIIAEYQLHLKEKDPTAQPNFTSLEGYIAAKMMAEGLRRAGKDLTVESFTRGMESIKEYDMGGFMLNFSDKNHSGSSFVELTMIGKKKDFVH